MDKREVLELLLRLIKRAWRDDWNHEGRRQAWIDGDGLIADIERELEEHLEKIANR